MWPGCCVGPWSSSGGKLAFDSRVAIQIWLARALHLRWRQRVSRGQKEQGVCALKESADWRGQRRKLWARRATWPRPGMDRRARLRMRCRLLSPCRWHRRLRVPILQLASSRWRRWRRLWPWLRCAVLPPPLSFDSLLMSASSSRNAAATVSVIELTHRDRRGAAL